MKERRPGRKKIERGVFISTYKCPVRYEQREKGQTSALLTCS